MLYLKKTGADGDTNIFVGVRPSLKFTFEDN
jgi:hypothetical protein